MFINCPFCQSLVATDPATDQPPERCPRCAARLRGLPTDIATAPPPPAPHESGSGPAQPVFDLLEVPTPETLAAAASPVLPATGLAAQIHQTVAPGPAPDPIAPIATLLRPRAPAPEPEAQPEAGPDPAPAAAQEAEAPTPTPGPAVSPSTAPPASGAVTPPTPAGPDGAIAGPDSHDAADTAVEPAAGRVEEAATDAPAGDAGDSPADPSPAPAPPAPAASAARAPTPARAMPSFARRRRRRASGFDWKSGIAVAGLALLLVLQLLLADRAHLAADARWRPLLANVCGVLGCSLPPWREPGAFSVLARDVRPHPSKPGALRVTATFRNDARWPQSWPRVRLTLSDVNGNAVAARDFDASDYLGEAPAQAELRSGQSASIAMDVLEPAARSVAFDFELY